MEKNNIPLVHEIMQIDVSNKVSIELVHILKDKVLEKFIDGTLFVIDSNEKLIGVLTDGDVRKCFSSNLLDHNIENYISLDPKYINVNESASVALRIIRENEINTLPVIDHNSKIVGYLNIHLLLHKFSPERLYMTGRESQVNDNEEKHLSRYNFALNFIKGGGLTLDCACGSGYGSKILCAKSKNVLGVDLSSEAIQYANENNSFSNIEFRQGDLDHLKFDKLSLDSVISIETLEHVTYDVFLRFLENINIWLKDGGLFVGSSPMLRYKNGKPYITNPYHINEMPRDKFLNDIRLKLKNFEVHFYYQDHDAFLPLCEENTGFCIVVARKRTNGLSQNIK